MSYSPARKSLSGLCVKGDFACSSQNQLEFGILNGEWKVKKKLIALDFRRADFGIFKNLLERVTWDRVLKEIRA